MKLDRNMNVKRVKKAEADCASNLEAYARLLGQAKRLEAQCADIKLQAVTFAQGVLEVCEFLDNTDHHYTRHTQDHLAKLESTNAGKDLLERTNRLQQERDALKKHLSAMCDIVARYRDDPELTCEIQPNP